MGVFELYFLALHSTLLVALAWSGRTALTVDLLLIKKFLLNLVEGLGELEVLFGGWLYNFHGEGSSALDGIVLDGPVVDDDELSEEGFTLMKSLLSLMIARPRGIFSYLQIYLVSWEVEVQLWSRIRVLRRVPVRSTELTKIRMP